MFKKLHPFFRYAIKRFFEKLHPFFRYAIKRCLKSCIHFSDMRSRDFKKLHPFFRYAIKRCLKSDWKSSHRVLCKSLQPLGTQLCPFSKRKIQPYEAYSLTASILLHRLVLSLELGTVQTGTGKVNPARKFKCTTADRVDYCFLYSIQ